jgi:O6-methylguanine-DNA--protein-cysteine methyltransferase
MGASGKITGYSGGDGIPTKRKLLALEKIEYVE